MSRQWFYKQQDGMRGPVTDAELRQMIRSKQIDESGLIWREGMPAWIPASMVDVSQCSEEPAPPPIQSVAPPPRFQRPSPPRPHTPLFDYRALWVGLVCTLALISAIGGWVAIQLRSSSRDHVANRHDAVNSQHGLSGPQEKSHESSAENRLDHAQPPSSSGDRPPSQDLPTRESSDNRLPDRLQPPDSTSDPAAQATPNTRSSDPPASVNHSTSETGTQNHSNPAEQPIGTGPPTPTSTDQGASESAASPQSNRQEPVAIYQELSVQRRPTLVVEGLPVEQQLEYRVLSRLEIGARGKRGEIPVVQRIIDAKLDHADPLSRATFRKAIRDLPGQAFKFQVTSRHEVIRFSSDEENPKPVPVREAERAGFMITSVIDRDGWKEFAQLSFFRPLPNKQTWVGQMAHDWGVLGSWTGETRYEKMGRRQNIRQINYAHNMKHVPPADGDEESPIKLTGVRFEPVAAAGIIRYDTRLQRVVSLEEKFHVQGALETVLLGRPTRVLVEERQVFKLRLLDQNPWTQ